MVCKWGTGLRAFVRPAYWHGLIWETIFTSVSLHAQGLVLVWRYSLPFPCAVSLGTEW